MNLQHHINYCIYAHPSLYRVRNSPEESRLHVLEHLFFTIGGGYEWDKRGFLRSIDDNYEEQVMEKLPEGFFEKELYDVEVHVTKLAAVLEDIGNRFYYRRPKGSFGYLDRTTIIFESTEDEAIAIRRKWDYNDHGRQFVYAHKRENEFDLNPYELSEYSGLIELMSGRNKSFHTEEYSFADHPVMQEWLDGAVEVARSALEYYHDNERVKQHHSYPTSGNVRVVIYDYHKMTEEEQAECRKKHKCLPDETIEERYMRYFNDFRTKQINLLNQFLEEFAQNN
jgi:hypothetical protein